MQRPSRGAASQGARRVIDDGKNSRYSMVSLCRVITL